jgi:nuclear transport factor 2 (NTF2) superfamily protein
MDATIEKAVETICNMHDQIIVEAFLFITDLLTNADYDKQDRELAAFHTQRVAFRFTQEFEDAQDAYLNRINPGRAQLRKAVGA